MVVFSFQNDICYEDTCNITVCYKMGLTLDSKLVETILFVRKVWRSADGLVRQFSLRWKISLSRSHSRWKSEDETTCQLIILLGAGVNF